MIQRIQTLYLLLVLIIGILYFFIPYASFQILDTTVASIFVSGVKFEPNSSIAASINMNILVIIVLLSEILTLVVIFLFKKRLLQIKLVKFNMLLVIATFVTMFLYARIIKTAINAEMGYYYAAIFPIISLIFLFLAFKAIRKDEELVKSADRLR